VKFHGRLVSEHTAAMTAQVKPLIPQGGRIILDLGDLEYMDSSGLAALVGVKASAINQGYCKLELENLTPKLAELLRITKLTQLFSS
jgi:anti-anti-sigma factor